MGVIVRRIAGRSGESQKVESAPESCRHCSAARWLEEHGDMLYRMALARTGDPVLSEDLVQETLLSAWQGRDQFAGRSTERTWLVAILKRKVIDHFRRSWQQGSLSDNSEEAVDVDDFVRNGEFAGRWRPDMAPADWGGDPELLLQQRQLRQALSSCIKDLPESLARVFTVREIDGLSTEEICQEFSLSPSNVWMLLHRARLRLRRCMEKSCFGPGA